MNDINLKIETMQDVKDLSIDQFYVDKTKKIVDWELLGTTINYFNSKFAPHPFIKNRIVHAEILRLFNGLAEDGILSKGTPQEGDYLIEGCGLEAYFIGSPSGPFGDTDEEKFKFYPKTKYDAENIADYLTNYISFDRALRIKKTFSISQLVEERISKEVNYEK